MSNSSHDSLESVTLDQRGWVKPIDTKLALHNREMLARCLLGYFKDTERFTAAHDRDYVYENGLYNVNGALLLLESWIPNTSLRDFQVAHMGLWIQIHGIPVEYFENEDIYRLGSTAGEVIGIEWNSEPPLAERTLGLRVESLLMFH
ncbi:hypothetical protein LIER_41341 [Lithospermum erythrorhizon]|uniref:DUF4283 domain-containing protein n=1 Tax=Lithospermum erythrorhizon TaxID=34254 RepID=A0AAV3R7U6_LITER